MYWLVALVLAFALLQGTAAIKCNTSGTVGEWNQLIQYVIVDFEAPITTTLTNEELRLSFVLRVDTAAANTRKTVMKKNKHCIEMK